MAVEAPDADAQRASSKSEPLSELPRTPGQVLLLCWTHAVIGFGFFGVPLASDTNQPTAGAMPVCCLPPAAWWAVVCSFAASNEPA